MSQEALRANLHYPGLALGYLGRIVHMILRFVFHGDMFFRFGFGFGFGSGFLI